MKTQKLIFLSAVLFLLAPLASHAQTHQFCPTDATCTWTGPQTFNGPVSIPGNVSVGGTTTHTGPASFAKGFLGPDPWADVTANGLVGDGSTDNTAAFNTLTASACSSGTKYLWFPSPGNYVFKSKPNAIHCGLYLVSPISLGAAYGFGSFLTVTYNEATPTNGFLWWDGANASTQGNGGGVIGLNILVNPVNTAGALIRADAAGGCTNRAGDMMFQGFKLGGGGGGNSSYGMYLDGSGCTTAGTPGLRDIHINFVLTFNTTVNSVKCINCTHFYWANGVTSAGTGVGDASFTGLGSGTSATTDATLDAVSIFGNFSLDFATQMLFNGVITGTVSCTGNTTNSAIFGDYTPPATPCAGVSTFPSAGAVHQANGPFIANSGGATAFQGTCPAGAFCSNTGSAGTQGSSFFGNTSNLFRMQNSNAFLSWDGAATQPYLWTPTAFTMTKPLVIVETTNLCGSGLGTDDFLCADTSDHMFHQNLNNGGNQQISITGTVTSNQAIASTTFATVTNQSFSAGPNRNYTLRCEIAYQASATTAGPKFQITGPASPTAVMLNVDGGTNTTAYANGSTVGFSTPNATLGTTGAAGTFIAHINATIMNGANTGAVALQAAANGAGTMTINQGSGCVWQ